jgi:hypothetical protein
MQTARPVYIVFQAYGDEAILQECVFALLSFSKWHKKEDLDNVEIWIYTDKPEYFQQFKNCWLPLNYRVVGAALIKQWRGEIDFVHRVKIEVLLDFTKEYEGNILYLDSDIVFLQPISDVAHEIDRNWGDPYMHVSEGNVFKEANPIFKKLSQFLKNESPVRLLNGEALEIWSDEMWNAGVLGFKTSYSSLNEVLLFTDSVYPKFPKHIVEQFAFSLYFCRGHQIKTASPYILHYWNLKELRPVLASFLDRFKDANWDDLVKYSELIQVPVLMQEKISFLNNKGLFGSRQWHASIPNWDLWLKQLQ